jgi:unsaturated chondroitin disaccharide hydrolase
MLHKQTFFAVLLLFCAATMQSQSKSTSLLNTINSRLSFAEKQEKAMAQSLLHQNGMFPLTLDERGKLKVCDTTWWTCGFFPGTLWYLYENSKSELMKQFAQQYSNRLEGLQYATNTHDIGFIIYCSFGNGYRLTGDADYKHKIEYAAKSLCTRFNSATGCIKSWDRQGVYPVIIDNMMNLELLFEASKLTGNPTFKEIAISHANTTMKNHFRPNGSCYHVVNYNPETGAIISRKTRQGYADESSWARGQAWALYGYTMCYRETKDPNYLQQAEKVAAFILNHPRLPKNKIPYWDFDDPKIPDTYRDASAGAVICSALIELSQYVSKPAKSQYLKAAKTQLLVLSDPQYLAKAGTNGNFLLLHSVGSLPDNAEVDVPLSYADYYYIEALLRYKKILLHTPLF